MIQIFQHDLTVCGLGAWGLTISQRQEHRDASILGEPATGILIHAATTVRFMFRVYDEDLARISRIFPVGEGRFATHYLGPSDVCRFCGNAWLPGTFICPSCGGETDHFDRALEYRSNMSGVITSKELSCGLDDPACLDVEVQYHNVLLSYEQMFAQWRHSLWGEEPAIWVCRFCGYVVRGKEHSCPGCGGSRAKAEALATQHRYCIYCNQETTGGYACRSCNQRLMAYRRG